MFPSIVLSVCLATLVFGRISPRNTLYQISDGLDIGISIINGEDAEKGEFPWQVSLQVRGEENRFHHFCGGSIIDERRILTAAHCVDKVPPIMVRILAGAHNIAKLESYHQIGGVKNIKIHEKYTDTIFVTNDIAIIELRQPLKFDEHVQPIELCKTTPAEGDSVVSTGWGNAHPDGDRENPVMPDILQKVTLEIPKRQECLRKHPFVVRKTMICAGPIETDVGYGACNGDSGGPLVYKPAQQEKFCIVGIASFVSARVPCGFAPTIYTSVPDFLDWISVN